MAEDILEPSGKFLLYQTEDGEITEAATCKEFLQVRQEGCLPISRSDHHDTSRRSKCS
jgi:hypothetical protein